MKSRIDFKMRQFQVECSQYSGWVKNVSTSDLSQNRRSVIVSNAGVLPIERRLEEGAVGELERLPVHRDQLKNIGLVLNFEMCELILCVNVS